MAHFTKMKLATQTKPERGKGRIGQADAAAAMVRRPESTPETVMALKSRG
jgi:hypothetical protein